jgi:hypothetical protein
MGTVTTKTDLTITDFEVATGGFSIWVVVRARAIHQFIYAWRERGVTHIPIEYPTAIPWYVVPDARRAVHIPVILADIHKYRQHGKPPCKFSIPAKHHDPSSHASYRRYHRQSLRCWG